MFKVIDKTTGEIFTVYGLNGTHFLVYNAELEWWFYKDMNECRPYVSGDDSGTKVMLDPEVFGRFIK